MYIQEHTLQLQAIMWTDVKLYTSWFWGSGRFQRNLTADKNIGSLRCMWPWTHTLTHTLNVHTFLAKLNKHILWKYTHCHTHIWWYVVCGCELVGRRGKKDEVRRENVRKYSTEGRTRERMKGGGRREDRRKLWGRREGRCLPLLHKWDHLSSRNKNYGAFRCSSICQSSQTLSPGSCTSSAVCWVQAR